MRTRTPKPSIRLTEAEAFFYEWAGWSYKSGEETPAQSRTRGAIDLAAAEQWAEEQGLRVEWEPEGSPDVSWCDECVEDTNGAEWTKQHSRSWHEAQQECAVLLDGEDAVLASLGNIDRPSNEYRRVVAAELALEARTTGEWASVRVMEGRG